jgi:hypothetical protein
MPDPAVEPPFDCDETIADSDECMACDRPAVIDGYCRECMAGEELHLTEDERIMCRDFIATFLIDETGTHRYDVADAIWTLLYRKGFDIMRRPVAWDRSGR